MNFKLHWFFVLFVFMSFKSGAQVNFVDNAPCTTAVPSSASFTDWKVPNYTIYTISLGTKTVESPFYNVSLTNPNINEFSQYTLKDYEPSDGWELLQYDFGTPSIGTDAPYLMLYNRHTGLLRVFIAFASLFGQNNAVSLELGYVPSETRSALLENFSATGRHATENFNNNVPPISQNNFYLNQVLKWYHADYYLQYDPCICNYETALEFKVTLATNSTLQFTMEGQALQNLNPPYSTDSYGRTGNIGMQSANGSKVTGVFRNMGKASDWADKVIQKKENYLGLSAEKKTTLSNIFGAIGLFMPGIAGVADFLIGLFKDDPAPQPPRPLMLDISLTASGSITTSFPYGYKKLIVPGSEQTLVSTTVRPFYNKAPGGFTLLKEPIIRWAYRLDTRDEWTPEMHEAWWTYAFKLPENLSYTVNPHAGFDLSQSQIKASLVFTQGNNFFETNYYELGCLNGLQKSFQRYTYDGWDGSFEEGFIPDKVQVKIIANFKVTGTSTFVPYVATYETTLVQDQNLDPFYEALPDTSCNLGLSPATALQIKAVCNGNIYKDKVQEFRRRIFPVDSLAALSDRGLNIYPTPAFDFVVVDLTQLEPASNNLKLEIIDMGGKVISTNFVGTGRQNKVSLSGLKSGFYIGRIHLGKKEIKFKIVKL